MSNFKEFIQSIYPVKSQLGDILSFWFNDNRLPLSSLIAAIITADSLITKLTPDHYSTVIVNMKCFPAIAYSI